MLLVGVGRHGQEEPSCRNNKNPGREVMNNENATAVETQIDVTPVSNFKENAMPLIARGIPVIPIPAREKGTRLKGWQNLATTDPVQIEKWHEDNFQYNCGAVAKLDSFWFLDCDVPDLPQQIEKDTGQVFPQTFSVRSNKGLHFYFKHTAASRALKKNIQLKDEQGNVLCDVKVHNGYVVAPGSIHPSGKRYEIVHEGEIMPAPDWLVIWIKEQHQHAEADEQQHSQSEEKKKEGGREEF